MSVSEVSDDEGSQLTRQTTKSRKFSDTKWKSKLCGDIEELGDNVYVYGSRNQGDKYVRTTEAIGDYVGREYNKAMRVIVRKKIEKKPEEPEAPDDEEMTEARMKKYEKAMDRYYKKIDQYEEYKAKVFVIILGQCTLSMKNKIESLKEFEKLEEEDDVIGLLSVIKSLAYTTHQVQYEHWTACSMMRRVLTMRQFEDESLAAFYKRFTSAVDVTESVWGLLVPIQIVNRNKSGKKDERNRFLACVFLAGVDGKRYGKLVDELNNSFIAGNDNYPRTVEGAMTMMSHYKDGGQDGSRKSRTNHSYAQARENVTCFKCGKKGHYANECNNVNGDDSSVESVRSRESSRRRWHL